MISWVILACEVGFWVLLGAGLLARYGLRWPRTSTVLLVGVPVVDLVLLVVAVVDLRRGADATLMHAAAAVYIGFSVGFGHATIAGLDAWAAHRFAGAPRPQPVPRTGPAGVRAAWSTWRRGLRAWASAAGLLIAAVVLIGDAGRSAVLLDTAGWLSLAVVAGLVHPVGRAYQIRTTKASARTTGR